MRVNFSVTNQLATPAIHAAALANRPPAGQPGRLFVDTDNPSSGIYRDTGSVWENITGGASAGNLQTVTDAGNTTDNNILLTYADNTIANALVFYNDALAQEEYLIEKRGTGITTNDSLAIQSRGNISPSTNPVGFLIDGANDIVKSFYTTAYSEVGLKLDFASQNYKFGNLDNVVYGNLEIYDFDTEDYLVSLRSKSLNYDADMSIKLIPDEQIKLRVESISNPNVYSAVDFQTGGNRLELKNNDLTTIIQGQTTTITNSLDDAGNSTSLALFTILDFANSTAIHKTQYNGNDVGLKLDFANTIYSIGWNNATKGLIVNQSNSTIYLGDDAVSGTGAGIKIENDTDIYVGDYTQGFADGLTFSVTSSNNIIKTAYQGTDVGIFLDFTNNLYQIGGLNANGNYIEVDDFNSKVRIVTQGNRVMFEATQTNTTIGDVTGVNNSTTFGVDDTLQTLTGSGNLLVGTSGPASGQHLKINVGGTDYVIELKDP